MLTLYRIPRQLRDSRFQRRFRKLTEGTTFGDWWNQFGGQDRDKVLALNFPPGIWDIPWEVLIERLAQTGKHSRMSLTRTTTGKVKMPSPRVFDEPLRSLILIGDDGSSVGLRRLDLQSEANLIQEAW